MQLLYRLGLVGLLVLVCTLPRAAMAQDNEQAGTAKLWLDDAFKHQTRVDTMLRYVGAPADVVGGGAMLLAAGLSASNLRLSIPQGLGGAALITGAFGTWFSADPYVASRWAARGTALGFFGLGLSTLLLELHHCNGPYAEGCANSHPDAHRASLAGGTYLAAMELTVLLYDLLMPPPDPRRVRSAIDARQIGEYAGVRDFLRARERRRRVINYLLTPLTASASVSAFYVGAASREGEVRAIGYTLGGVIAAAVITAVIFEVLRTPDDVRLEAGELPGD